MENNRLIAEFMGLQKHTYKDVDRYLIKPMYMCPVSELQYHTSWDWLMPVVDFIESMGFTVRVESSTDIIGPHYYGCWIWQDPEDNPVAATAHMATRIEAVYICVVEFIEWYNSRSHA